MNRMPIPVDELVATAVYGWLDIAGAAAFLAGVVLLGLFGDRLVGAIVAGAIELPAAVARIAARVPRPSVGTRRRAQARIVTGSSRSSSPS
jgi:hypothetical protein